MLIVHHLFLRIVYCYFDKIMLFSFIRISAVRNSLCHRLVVRGDSRKAKIAICHGSDCACVPVLTSLFSANYCS